MVDVYDPGANATHAAGTWACAPRSKVPIDDSVCTTDAPAASRMSIAAMTSERTTFELRFRTRPASRAVSPTTYADLSVERLAVTCSSAAIENGAVADTVTPSLRRHATRARYA